MRHLSEKIEAGLQILFIAALALATLLVYRGSRDELTEKRAALLKEFGDSLALTDRGLQFLLNPHVIPGLIRTGDRRRAERVISDFLKEGAELSAVIVAAKDLKPFAMVSPKGEFQGPGELERFLAESARGEGMFLFRRAPESLVIRHPIVEGGVPDGTMLAKVDLEHILRRLRTAHAYPIAVRLSGVREEHGRPRAAVDAPISASDVFQEVAENRLGVVLLILLAGALLYVLCRLLVRKMIYPFELLVLKLDAVIRGNRETIDPRHYPAWLGPFLANINSLIASVIETQERERRAIASLAFQETASQVAHDIRSPLAALDSMAGVLAGLPEENRLLVRAAVGRIKDIANNLAERTRPSDRQTALLSSLIEPLISEKRMRFASRQGLELDFTLDEASYGLFAKVQPAEFKRALSNLIDNAVEALGERGRVRIGVSPESEGLVAIRIEDDGRGIAPNVLSRLGQKGETHGKEGGAGLGLYHARAQAEAWGGSLTIRSEPGKGTLVTLSVPRAAAPPWFVSRLELPKDGEVVILDDDASIHGIWKDRLGKSGVPLRHFTAPGELRKWAQGKGADLSRALFLIDYEFSPGEETGLDLIRSLDLAACSVLVTSRFEESGIQARCAELGVRLVPKGLAGFVPTA